TEAAEEAPVEAEAEKGDAPRQTNEAQAVAAANPTGDGTSVPASAEAQPASQDGTTANHNPARRMLEKYDRVVSEAKGSLVSNPYTNTGGNGKITTGPTSGGGGGGGSSVGGSGGGNVSEPNGSDRNTNNRPRVEPLP